jgi:hypothetical protein
MSARLGVQSAWACLMRRREWFPLAAMANVPQIRRHTRLSKVCVGITLNAEGSLRSV